MKRFITGLFALLMVCFLSTAFSAPKTTISKDVGYTCVNQTHLVVSIISDIPVIEKENLYIVQLQTAAQSINVRSYQTNKNMIENIYSKSNASQNKEINRGIYRLDIGEINNINVTTIKKE